MSTGDWYQTSSTSAPQFYEQLQPHYWDEYSQRAMRQQEEMMRQQEIHRDYADQLGEQARRVRDERAMEAIRIFNQGFTPIGTNSSSSQSGDSTLMLIKKSIKQIKRDAISEEAQSTVKSKIERLKKLGAKAQAVIVEVELQLRMKLARIQEWDYKVLPHDAIKEYDGKTVNSWTIKVHIDPLDKYTGSTNTSETEAKDRIIPDFVLDKLEESKDRQIFDDISVLWVERVKDPLLLGSIKGCKDYFFICEWGEDVKFDDIIKPNLNKKEAK